MHQQNENPGRTPVLQARELVLVEHSNFIPLAEVSRFEGPRHRESVLNGARVVISEANREYDLLHDPLTGIPNNEQFNLALQKQIDLADKGEGSHPVLLFMDLDNFKAANDIIGHEKVDKMLIEIATELLSTVKLREVNGEIAARKSGDELLAMIIADEQGNDKRDINKTPEEIVDGFISRTEEAIANISAKFSAPFVGASIGYAIHEPGESLERLRTRADLAMYEEKKRRHGDRASSR